MPIGVLNQRSKMFCIFTLVAFISVCADIASSSGGAFLRASGVAKENGYEVHYCEWKGTRFLPDTDFKDYDSCVHCKCTKGMLSCNSMQETLYLSPSVEKDSDCEPLKVACHFKWVLKGNKSTSCPKHKIPEHQAII